MLKHMQQLKKIIRTNKNYKIFFITLFIIALVNGSIFALLISEFDSTLVTNYLNNYFTSIKDTNINFTDFFINNNINYLIFIIIMWLLGYSIIGLPINIIIFFGKSFTLGFSIASILVNYKLKGILIALIYVVPCQLIYLFIFYIILFYSSNVSIKLINSILKKETINFKNINNIYLIILVLSIITIVITTLINYVSNQYVLKYLLSMLI